MNLIYNSNETNANLKGQPVKVGDIVKTGKGETVTVQHFVPPHKPSSSGKVSVSAEGKTYQSEFYVGVIGAEWINREDQE